MTRPHTYRLLIFAAATLLLPRPLPARKFYRDDPIAKMPPPRNVNKVASNEIADIGDFFQNTFGHPGQRQANGRPFPAQEINTLGEVPDSPWYTNRHYRKTMTLEALAAGPGNTAPPSKDAPWKIISAKKIGIMPGFTIVDSRGHKYVMKFDSLSNPEMASAADVITSKFFYALGYNVPENYIVYFDRHQVEPGEDSEGKRVLSNHDLDEMLRRVPRTKEGQYRAMASRFIEGKIIGPRLYTGTRPDDPNDIVAHEQRRDLRGLYVFCAWLSQTDAKADNSLDTLVEQDGVHYVKHYLIDFGASLGSSSFEAKSAREGYEYLFEWGSTAKQVATLGLYVPAWARADYGTYPSVGRFESKVFDPDRWKPSYPNPAFGNRLPDDSFWAAKQVAAFTNEQIRAIVKTGQYSNPEAERFVADCLIARRDKIAKTFFSQVLPLDNFAVKDGKLTFDDLAVKYDLLRGRNYNIRWSWFDNDKEASTPLPDESSLAVPKPLMQGSGENYVVAEIRAEDARQSVVVYLRRRGAQVDVVGIERTWAS